MTNVELEAIYKTNMDIGHLTALRAVYTHGFYAGAGTTPTATSPDKSKDQAPPAVILKFRSRID